MDRNALQRNNAPKNMGCESPPKIDALITFSNRLIKTTRKLQMLQSSDWILFETRRINKRLSVDMSKRHKYSW